MEGREGGVRLREGWRRPRWAVCIRSAFYERDAFSRAALGLKARQEWAPSQPALSYLSQLGSDSFFRRRSFNPVKSSGAQ